MSKTIKENLEIPVINPQITQVKCFSSKVKKIAGLNDTEKIIMYFLGDGIYIKPYQEIIDEREDKKIKMSMCKRGLSLEDLLEGGEKEGRQLYKEIYGAKR